MENNQNNSHIQTLDNINNNSKKERSYSNYEGYTHRNYTSIYENKHNFIYGNRNNNNQVKTGDVSKTDINMTTMTMISNKNNQKSCRTPIKTYENQYNSNINMLKKHQEIQVGLKKLSKASILNNIHTLSKGNLSKHEQSKHSKGNSFIYK